MTNASLPTAYVARTSSPQARVLLAGARTALTVLFGLWPLSATMLAVGAMLASQ